MILFEEGLDKYLEDTSLFPHSKAKGGDKMAIKANPKMIKAEENARLKRIYQALGLTARGTLRKTAAEKRIEKLIGRQRG